MEKLLYGVAYYDEYMPYDRLDKDIEMMKEAGINTVRIAESTWSTLEPQNGTFNFYHIDRVLEAMHKANIKVIIGTPTYAIPTWMVKEHPNVLAKTPNGQNKYGIRQNMDITNPSYLFYSERIIRKLMEHVKDHPSIIGYQADNETKYYDTCGENVQLLFVKYIKDKFNNDLDKLNKSFGLDYWSNRINAWEDFPSVEGTINSSLSSEFAQFQRKLVTDFLTWQVNIINEYKKEGQFVTQNFDFDWRGYSYGVQSYVNHFEASKPFDIVSIDVYHPSQDELTGTEISFCGDTARTLKDKNYYVMETEAQGFAGWVPYEGQLRLQAFSHVASGASMIAYWHWHSIHNSFETFWKGLLSHDFEPNATYNEAKTIGKDFERLSSNLMNLKVENKVALLVDNHSLTSLNSFKYFTGGLDYNDYTRTMYDSMYRMNISCDIIDTTFENIEKYSLIVVPPLYSVSDEYLLKLNKFIKNGGNVIFGMRSGFCDENVKVRNSIQPGIIKEACGVSYNQFVFAKNTKIESNIFESSDNVLDSRYWIELLEAESATVLAKFDHHEWNKYAAVTSNSYGAGNVIYMGCLPTLGIMQNILSYALDNFNLSIAKENFEFPLISKKSINKDGKALRFYFNYSKDKLNFKYVQKNGIELIDNIEIENNTELSIEPWGVKIIEEI